MPSPASGGSNALLKDRAHNRVMRSTLALMAALTLVVCASSAASSISRGLHKAARPADEVLFTRLTPRSQELLYEYEVWVGNARGRRARPVAGGPGSHESPTWSPDGSRIAYTGHRAHGSEIASQIYTVDADGNDRRAVVAGASPDWSPDGREIAYIHGSAGGLDGIRAVTADGTHSRQVTTGWDLTPNWSPTGSMLAFDRAGALFVVDADGTSERQLTTGFTPAGEYTSGFSWSPDGRRLLYTRDVEDRFGTATGGGLYLINADGTGRRLLRRSGRGLAWSPDGRLIAIVLPGAKRRGIHLMQTDGRVVRRVTRGQDLRPVWSHDGKRIAFERYPRGGYETDVWVGNVDGSGTRNLTRTPRLSEHVGEWRPVPSA